MVHHWHTWSQLHDSYPRCRVHGSHLLRCCVQVDEAYLQFGPAHDIVGFMQSLGYKDFRTARQGEEKMEQFKRALKLTRPAFAATRSPMQQVPTWLAHHTVPCLLAAKHGSPCYSFFRYLACFYLS